MIKSPFRESTFERGGYRIQNIWECYVEFHHLKFNQVIFSSVFLGLAIEDVVRRNTA